MLFKDYYGVVLENTGHNNILFVNVSILGSPASSITVTLITLQEK